MSARDPELDAMGDLAAEGARVLLDHRVHVGGLPAGRVYSLALRMFAVFLHDGGRHADATKMIARALAHFDLPPVEAGLGPDLLALDPEIVREGRRLEELFEARTGPGAVTLHWLAASVAGHLAAGTPRDRIGPPLATALHNAATSGLPTH